MKIALAIVLVIAIAAMKIQDYLCNRRSNLYAKKSRLFFKALESLDCNPKRT